MEKEIRVLLILPFFYPHMGGSQKYAEEVYSTIIKNHPNFHLDVIAYNTDNAKEFEFYRGFNIHRVPCYNLVPGRFAFPKIIPLIKKLKELSENNYDFVNTHIRFFDPTWWAWWYAKKIGAKSFYTGHVPHHPVHQNKFVQLVAGIVDVTIAKYSLKKYDLVTFVNRASQKYFFDELDLRVKSHLTYIGVNTKKFKKQEREDVFQIPDSKVMVTKDEVLITYVGRLIWTKGVDMLYEVAKNLLKKYKNIKFVLAGPGELYEQLKYSIKKDGLEEKIALPGVIDYEEVKRLLSKSDIFVNPSHHNEGLPNTLLEAGASGCFVIATDNGGTKELIINRETGFLIPQKDPKALENALEEAIRYKDLREKLSENLNEKVINEFDWEVTSEKLYALLFSLV